MAGYKYYTILTDVGKQKLVEAISSETPLDFTEIAIGDANGVSYDPTGSETALKHIVFKKSIDSVSIDAIDKNIMIFEMVVPSSSGGYYMREAGLFASDGTLIAIARVAEQYKPLLAEGAGVSITVSMRIAVSSEAQIYINVPESINYATQNYVKEEFKKHKADENPHTQYVILEAYNEKIDELEQALASKAAIDHSHDFSSITGSMDFADNRLKGLLPISKGGTGNATGLNYKNFCELYASVCSMLGIENTPRTIQEFWNEMPSVLDITFLATGDNITDLPTKNYYYINITKQDGNLSWITIKSWRSNITYLAYVADDIVSTWVLVRKSDGSIPAEIISPTVLKYENSGGIWTETKLTTGETMLEGITSGMADNRGTVIFLPKKWKTRLSIIVDTINQETFPPNHRIIYSSDSFDLYFDSTQDIYFTAKIQTFI